MNKLDLVSFHESQSGDNTVLQEYEGTRIIKADVEKHVKYYTCCPEAFTDVSIYLELDNNSFAWVSQYEMQHIFHYYMIVPLFIN